MDQLRKLVSTTHLSGLFVRGGLVVVTLEGMVVGIRSRTKLTWILKESLVGIYTSIYLEYWLPDYGACVASVFLAK